MNLGQVLNVGSNGLHAAANGTAITSHNLTNAATEGYTRQLAVQRSRPLHLGGGVDVAESRRLADSFVERRLTQASALDGEAQARASTLAVLDEVFQDNDASIAAAYGRFESTLAGFADASSESAPRTTVLDAAHHLAAAFNRAGDALAGARADANAGIVREVEQVNARLQEIGRLNAKIGESEAGKQDASTLIDNRDALVREIGQRVPVTVLTRDDGAVTVMLGQSRILVSPDGYSHELTTTVDGDGNRVVQIIAGAQVEDASSFITSGSIYGYMDARDGALAQLQASVDELATDTIDAYNAVHSAGFGQDGVSGRDLFTGGVPGSGIASRMEVSPDVAGSPRFLAGAAAAGLSADNRVALELQAVGQQPVAAGGTATLAQSYAGLVGQAGTARASALESQQQAELTLDQTQRLRDSISAVSSDEEMVNLMRYQRAYQASLKVIQTADSLLEDLLNMR